MIISLSLPLPPGKNITNRAGVNRKTGMVYKPGAKAKNEYKLFVRFAAVAAKVAGVGMEGKLEMVVRWYFPNSRMDSDGPYSLLKDSVAEAVGFDDKQIKHDDITVMDWEKGMEPHVEVEVRHYFVQVPTEPHISVKPGMMFGEPSIFGHRLTALQFAEIWWHGQWTMEDILDNWTISRTDVLLCCWFEARHGKRRWQQRWGEWLAEWREKLWHSDYDNVLMPPQEVTIEGEGI